MSATNYETAPVLTGIIDRLLRKNRTIVSADAASCMDVLQERYPLTVHRFATGGEYQTWPVPPEWNPRRAVLTHRGEVIASYDESPLFLAPYSTSFSGEVSRDELIAHTFTNPAKPDAFCYEFRVAYNFQRRLREWRLSLPYARLQALPEGPFRVDIDVEVRPGHMLVGELAHPGASGCWFTLLAHYCHIGQANDGLAGVVVMLEAVRRVMRTHPQPRHGYKALVMPETIGSSIWAASHGQEIDATLGAVFSEMGGAESPMQLAMSRRGDTYIDRVFLQTLREQGRWPCRLVPFRKGWGNDELVFDAPGVGVPAVSLDRFPFEPYHTHFDDVSSISEHRLDETIRVIEGVVAHLEADYVPRPKTRVPVYLTRYDLYADWTHQRQQYDLNTLLLDSMWSGRSVLDIALQNDLDLSIVRPYIERFAELGLVERTPVTPEYTRTVRFLPAFAAEANV